MARFLVDEDMPRSLAPALREAGYMAEDVRDVGLRGASDAEVFALAVANGSALVSGDLGFSNILRFRLGTHSGILVARIPNEVPVQRVNQLVVAAVRALADDEIDGIQVEVEEGEPLDLAFPDTVVRGLVVDGEGEPVAKAIIRVRNVQQIQMSADLRSGDDGRFESIGLPTGRTVLMAEAFLRTSEPREVTLEEGREPPEVRLVVRKNSMLEGRVVSEAGSGVSGAKVTAVPVEALSMGGPILGTDAEGRFETDLPPGSRNVVLTIAAPGYAFRVLQVPLEEAPVAVPVGHAGGTLVLELPESLDLNRWDAQRPIIAAGLVGTAACRHQSRRCLRLGRSLDLRRADAVLERRVQVEATSPPSPLRRGLPFEPGSYPEPSG